MGFGSTVDALLEFYSTCISLLKTPKSRRGGHGSVAAREYDERAQLRRSMRSDRAQVRRAYSSGLSEAGSRFEKGDARARSSLSRVLKRLAAVIASILQLSGKNQQPVLDCESLMLLSNASRVQAIHTCDQLSRRLGSSPSRSSVASSSTKPKHRRQRPSSSVSSSKSSRSKPSRNSSRQSKKGRPTKVDGEEPRGKRRSPGPRSPSSMGKHERTGSGSREARMKRISLQSTSTYSTRLGEIPERKWKSRYSYDSDSEEYNVPPVYPLKTFEPPPKKSRFRDLFRRRA